MQEETHNGPSEIKIKIVDIEADEIQSFQVPSFVNYVSVWRQRDDVFLDMGLMPIEQMAAFVPGNNNEATVAIYDRFVMSPITFEELFERMTLLREQLRSQGLVRDEDTDTPKTLQPSKKA